MQLKQLRLKGLLLRLDRLFAWSLLLFVAIYFVTGYGMTKSLVSPEMSKVIHNRLLPIPSLVAFAFHSAFGVHVALKRWRVWHPHWRVALVVYAAALVVGVVAMQFFAGGGASSAAPARIEL